MARLEKRVRSVAVKQIIITRKQRRKYFAPEVRARRYLNHNACLDVMMHVRAVIISLKA